MTFEWDQSKNQDNKQKHNISFEEAQYAFFDTGRIIQKDLKHSVDEDRFFCIGAIGDGIVTVRFTMRKQNIRIFGAGYWREGKNLYEAKNKI
ncbi:MAG: BrnT family toxin [Spirochaetales bacterium]|nr:BrnT family toxin [Spirochaetales bacterium]